MTGAGMHARPAVVLAAALLAGATVPPQLAAPQPRHGGAQPAKPERFAAGAGMQGRGAGLAAAPQHLAAQLAGAWYSLEAGLAADARAVRSSAGPTAHETLETVARMAGRGRSATAGIAAGWRTAGAAIFAPAAPAPVIWMQAERSAPAARAPLAWAPADWQAAWFAAPPAGRGNLGWVSPAAIEHAATGRAQPRPARTAPPAALPTAELAERTLRGLHSMYDGALAMLSPARPPQQGAAARNAAPQAHPAPAAVVTRVATPTPARRLAPAPPTARRPAAGASLPERMLHSLNSMYNGALAALGLERPERPRGRAAMGLAHRPAMPLPGGRFAPTVPAAAPPPAATAVAAAVESFPRDPFAAPSDGTGAAAAPKARPPGLAGLSLDQVLVQAVALGGANGPVALVEGPQQQTYFLRAGTEIYDAQVVRVLPSGVVFERDGDVADAHAQVLCKVGQPPAGAQKQP